MEDEVRKKVDTYASELLSSYEDFESEGVHYLSFQSTLNKCMLVISSITTQLEQCFLQVLLFSILKYNNYSSCAGYN